jgi:fructokinase
MAASTASTTPRLIAAGLVALDVLHHRGGDRAAAFRAGGTAGNVASILGALGWTALATGPADDSVAFKVLLEDLHECGVEYYATVTGSVPVIVQELCDRGHSFSFDCPGCGRALPRFTRSSIAAHNFLGRQSTQADVFFADRLSADVLALARAARSKGAFVVYEPSDEKDAPWAAEMLAMASMVKCSSERAPQLSWLGDEGDYLEVHTLGADGLRWRWPTLGVGGWQQMPAIRAERVVDTCGAGDWLTSGILFGLREYAADIRWGARRCAEQILASAQHLAAWSCGFAGARGALYEAGPATARSILGRSSIDPVRVDPLPEPSTSTACGSCPV